MSTLFYTANDDYTGVSRSEVQFNERTTATVTVSINNDSQVEDTESFFGKLESSDSAVQIGVDTATVNIVDNDCKFIRSHHLLAMCKHEYEPHSRPSLIRTPVTVHVKNTCPKLRAEQSSCCPYTFTCKHCIRPLT